MSTYYRNRLDVVTCRTTVTQYTPKIFGNANYFEYPITILLSKRIRFSLEPIICTSKISSNIAWTSYRSHNHTHRTPIDFQLNVFCFGYRLNQKIALKIESVRNPIGYVEGFKNYIFKNFFFNPFLCNIKRWFRSINSMPLSGGYCFTRIR